MAETSLSILERAKCREDDRAWQEMWDLYAPLLFKWIARYDVSSHDAEDVLQEVLQFVAENLIRFDHNGSPGAFRSWLRQVLVNRLRKHWERNKRRPAPLDGSDVLIRLQQLEDPASGLSRQWDRQHDHHISQELLKRVQPRFSESTWRAFCLTVLEDRKPADIAGELDMTPNAVCAAKCRVLHHLRQLGRGLVD